MPDNPKAVPSAAPSLGFLQKMFGASPITPAQQQGIDIAKKEMPNMAPVEPYGFFSRLLNSGANAYASPMGNKIYMNPAGDNQDPQSVADMLTHEQTHINQNQERGYGPTGAFLRQLLSGGGFQNLPYGQRPDEMAAFQAEKNRRYAMGRPQTPIPSFQNPGQYYTPGEDINLPNETRRVTPSPAVQQRMIGPVTTPTGPYTGR